MENNVSKFITVRGKFNRCNNKDGENCDVMVTELSGTASLLIDEPQVIINEECETNLTEFLKENVPMDTYITIRRVVVGSINDLFRDNVIIEKWGSRNLVNFNITDKLHEENGILMLGSRSLYDIFWNKNNGGCTYQYSYVEIYVHNGEMPKSSS